LDKAKEKPRIDRNPSQSLLPSNSLLDTCFVLLSQLNVVRGEGRGNPEEKKKFNVSFKSIFEPDCKRNIRKNKNSFSFFFSPSDKFVIELHSIFASF